MDEAKKERFDSAQSDGLTASDKEYLLSLAREAVTRYLSEGLRISGRAESLSPAARGKRGCFVTLLKDGKLRGCIGYLQPRSELCDCVIENAINAAFHDTRFPTPVGSNELALINFEISVLTEPEKLQVQDREELLDHLAAGKDGVVLVQGRQQATFLPQVWEHFPDAESFLQALCRKGGMPYGCWRHQDTDIYTYRAIVFGEENR
ncbi:MAG: AmmeMemoRadiSam system protein A [Deltaproteobacteria bacterium]|nr:AmmeMemoRadiSam system protein A [Deltaproteobacteria bacterium]